MVGERTRVHGILEYEYPGTTAVQLYQVPWVLREVKGLYFQNSYRRTISTRVQLYSCTRVLLYVIALSCTRRVPMGTILKYRDSYQTYQLLEMKLRSTDERNAWSSNQVCS